MLSNNNYREKQLFNAIVVFSGFVLSLNENIVGPSLNELQRLVNTNEEQFSYLFLTKGLFFILGCLLLRSAYNDWNREYLFSLCLALFGISSALTPQTEHLSVLFMCCAVNGFVTPGVAIASIVQISRIWREQCHRYYQIFFLFMGIGEITAPLMLVPFLSSKSVVKECDSHIQIPFAISGVLSLISSSLVLAFQLKRTKETNALDEDIESEENYGTITKHVAIGSDHGSGKPMASRVFVTISSLMTSISSSMITLIILYLPTFLTHLKLGISDQKSSIIVFAFSASLTSFKIIGVLIANRVSPKVVLAASLLETFLMSLFIFFLGCNSEFLLWLSFIGLGLTCSMTAPSLFAFINERSEITENILFIIFIVIAIIHSLIPILIGRYISENPMVFVYLIALLSFSSLILFIIMIAIDFSTNLQRSKSLDTDIKR